MSDEEETLDIDLSLLQLHDFPNAKLKIDSLFQEWLLSTLSDGGQTLLAELQQAILVNKEKSQNNTFNFNITVNETNSSSMNPTTMLPAASIYFSPPLSPNNLKKSPKKRTQSEMMLTRTNNGEIDSMTLNNSNTMNVVQDDELSSTTRRRSNFDTIPIFYNPNNHRKNLNDDSDLLTVKLPEIEAFFKPFKDGIPIDKFVHVTKRLCNLPSYFNVPFCERILSLYGNQQSPTANNNSSINNNKITIKIFLQYWKNEIEPYDVHERFFRLIKSIKCNYILKDDFMPYLHELLRFHPGLDFLDGHEEFQRKYALTVITRIFYKVSLFLES